MTAGEVTMAGSEPDDGLPRDLVSRFEHMASAHADEVAVIETSAPPDGQAREYRYAALDRRRLEIAGALVTEHGVGPGDRVGLVQSRRFDTLAAMLGIATIGAVYVPIDCEWPARRRRFVTTNASLRVTLSATGAAADALSLSGLQGSPAQHDAVSGATPLYVMYTSGSTGQPKGVVIPHQAVHRLVVAADFMPLDSDTRFLHFAPQSFDAATLEIWGPLLNGGTCVLCPDGVVDPELFEAIIQAHRVSAMWLTAALFNQLVTRRPPAIGRLDTLLFGGERASVAHVREAAALWPETTLVNGYGPTENTTFTCCHRVRPEDIQPGSRDIPIGRPIAGTVLRVVDENLDAVPAGATGELLAGGAGLALEYLGRPELTAERFVTGPDGRRWYRTGDLVSEDPDGVIRFHGRADRQLKIHGHRIEPGEVEAALLEDDGLSEAHVLAVKTPGGDQKLAAYLVGEFDRRQLQARLAVALPRFMLPSVFVGIDELPTTRNGKVDVEALPDPFQGQDPGSRQTAGTDRTTRGLIGDTWREVVSGIALDSDDDNFFDVGGTSMDMIRVRETLQKRLSRDIPLVSLFQYPTVAKLAAHLDALGTTADTAGSARDRAARRRENLARRKAVRTVRRR